MERYIDPETFNRDDVMSLWKDIEEKYNDLGTTIGNLEFMLEESPNKFKYIEHDCRYLRLELEEAMRNSSLGEDVNALFEEEEEDEDI